MHRKFSKIVRGFSLLEIIIVMAIVALLSVVILVAVSTSRMKARDGRRVADINQMRLVLEQYFAAEKTYPTVGLQGYCGTQFVLAKYLPMLPKDPSSTSAACDAQAKYEYYAPPGLTPQEYLLRTTGFEFPNGVKNALKDDIDGTTGFAPKSGTRWGGGTNSYTVYDCATPSGQCCIGGACVAGSILNCGTPPEGTAATAVYCIRS